MTWAMTLAEQQQSEFGRYSYARCCLYFAVAALESYLNQTMRVHLERSGRGDDEIKKELWKPFKNKLKWPRLIFERDMEIGDALRTAMQVRNEVTHPKHRDHRIYIELDAIDLRAVVNDLSLYIVQIHEADRKPFPYWVLGWNYVVVLPNAIQVLQGSNMNNFYFSLRNMGIITGYHLNCGDWDEKNMISATCFYELRNLLQERPYDIEPADGWPFRNRLTRRWWDDSFIRTEWASR
jgi:hypothetical protein